MPFIVGVEVLKFVSSLFAPNTAAHFHKVCAFVHFAREHICNCLWGGGGELLPVCGRNAFLALAQICVCVDMCIARSRAFGSLYATALLR